MGARVSINRWGWDTSLDDPPVVLWRIVPDETLEWIRSTMDHGGLSTLKPGCICGLNKDGATLQRREGYSLHAKPSGFCERHQKEF
jgi:hypothetical protein